VKRIKLTDKILHARENREQEITHIKRKAQDVLENVEDTKYILQLTEKNLQLDITNKLNETKDRREQ